MSDLDSPNSKPSPQQSMVKLEKFQKLNEQDKFSDQEQETQQQQQVTKTSNKNEFNPNKTQEDVFLTDFKNQGNKSVDPQVSKLSGELNDLVYHLEGKIDGLIEKHDGEFAIAYKNHMQKIQRELTDMKRKVDEQEKNFFAKDRIAGLERQLVWFREESSRLYNKLEQKNKESDELRLQIQDLEKDKAFLEGQVKSLMRKEKSLKVVMGQMQNQMDETMNNPEILRMNQTFTDEMNTILVKKSEEIRQLVHFSQANAHSKFIVDTFQKNIFENNINDIQGCAIDIINYVKKIDDDKIKQVKQVKEKSDKLMKEKLQLHIVRSDLESFFLECIETVRRQVIKRKYGAKESINQQQYLNDLQDYNVFRLEDKQKILELLVQHEKILLYIYQKIFPTQFNEHVKNVLENEKNAQSFLGNNTNDFKLQEIENTKNNIISELEQITVNQNLLENNFRGQPIRKASRRQQRVSSYHNKGPSQISTNTYNNNNQSFDQRPESTNMQVGAPPLSAGFNATGVTHNYRSGSHGGPRSHPAPYQLDGIVNNGRRKGSGKDRAVVKDGKLYFRNQ